MRAAVVRTLGLSLVLLAGAVLAQTHKFVPYVTPPFRAAPLAVEDVEAASLDPSQLDIFKFPTIGPSRTQWYDGSIQSTRPDSCLLYLGAGNSGVVRYLWLTGGNESNWNDLKNYELRIYIGGGNLPSKTAASNATYLSTKIRLGPLLGAIYDADGPVDSLVTTPFLDYGSSDGSDATVALKLPIPFENGILIQMWNWTNNSLVADTDAATDLITYTWAGYETGTTTSALQQWRLQAGNIYRKRVAATDTETVIFNTSSPGKLVGIFCSVKDSSLTFLPNWAEGNWRIYADGAASPTWETSGGEDIFGINPNYFSLGTPHKYEWGTTYLRATAIHYSESYREFVSDPPTWTSSAKFALQQNATDPKLYVLDLTALYYTAPAVTP